MAQSSRQATQLVYVHNAPIPSTAANSVQVVKMCAAFERAGISTTLVLPRNLSGTAEQIQDTYGDELRLKVHGLVRTVGPGANIVFGLHILSRYGWRRDTLFYTRSVSVAFSLALFSKNVVLELHGPSCEMRPMLQRRLHNLLASGRVRHLVVISDALGRYFRQMLPDAAFELCVARDGADAISAPPTPVKLSGDFKVGYVGQLYPGKGMELVADIAERLPRAVFHIVGGTSDTLAYWRKKLAHQRNVVFHGYVRHAEAQAYVCSMDVLIAPYARVVRGIGGDNMNLADWMSPLKLFEYMSAGKPIVTSSLPVLEEFLANERNALLCDPDHPEEWANAISRLEASRELRLSLGQRAYRDFMAQYTWDQRARLILDFLAGNIPH